MWSIEKKQHNNIHKDKINEVLNNLQKLSFDDIDTNKLKTYEEYDINTNLPKEERLLQYLLQEGNLYFGKTNSGVVVQRSFMNNGKTMHDKIIENVNR